MLAKVYVELRTIVETIVVENLRDTEESDIGGSDDFVVSYEVPESSFVESWRVR